jgi:hypothetical protein
VNTIRTANRKIDDWLVCEEIHKLSAEERNFYIAINPISTMAKTQQPITITA